MATTRCSLFGSDAVREHMVARGVRLADGDNARAVFVAHRQQVDMGYPKYRKSGMARVPQVSILRPGFEASSTIRRGAPGLDSENWVGSVLHHAGCPRSRF